MNEFLNNLKATVRRLLLPKEIKRTIREIDFGSLKARGINNLLIDIDETLLPRNENDIKPDLYEWLSFRKDEGFKICLTSNSRHPLRVKYIGDTLGVPAISMGFKPLPFAFHRALKLLNAKPEETAMIGDQLFMDTLGGNLVKLYTIHVQHQTPETFWPRIWMRQAEEWLLKPRS